MVKIGDYNILKVIKKLDFGIYLDGGESGEILMPTQYIPENTEIGDDLFTFIYLDSEDRLIATTLEPFVKVGGFAYLKALHVDKIGAFMDWGLPKDLLVPFSEQKQKIIAGEYYVVFTYLDEKTKRIVASTKLDKFLSNNTPDLHEGDEVDILIYQHTDLGYKAIVNDAYSGLLYQNELIKTVKIGERHTVYVKIVREDNKIDLIFRKVSTEENSIEIVAADILAKLDSEGGYMEIGDKSPADEIYKIFGVSKKVFKKALGNLYRKHLVIIEKNGIRTSAD